MKLLIALYILVTAFSTSYASDIYWTNQTSPTTKNLRNCFFINASTGWASGDSGIIIKTTNSGSNWNIQPTNINYEIKSIFFINNNTGWALAWVLNPHSSEYPGTMILRTSDGGNSWNNYMFSDTNTYLNVVYFLNLQNGFLGGNQNFILYTLNGGSTWLPASDSLNLIGFPVLEISFLNSTTGYACGGFRDLAGIVWKTTDTGLNWRPSILGPDALNDMYIPSEDTVFAVSGDFKFGASYYETINNGHSWTNYNLGYVGSITSIAFRTKKEGWMTIGYQQKLFLSTDFGNEWTIMDPPDNSQLFDIEFADSLNGWTVGEHGVIYKYNSLVNIEPPGYAVVNDFALYQNFPNPFNPKTIINYQCSISNYVTLKVFDALGNTIATLVNEKQKPGSYSVEFDANDLSSGIYYYTLSSGNYSVTKKMAVIK